MTTAKENRQWEGSTLDIRQYVTRRKEKINRALERYLPKGNNTLNQAMRYTVFTGGKRLRPILVMAATEIVGGKGEDAIVPACAVELAHAFTLIHDDLPCMDDDDVRRGKPSSHRVYGEAVAVLAGDALLNQAFQLIAESGLEASVAIQISKELAESLGVKGVIGGQVKDIQIEEGRTKLTDLNEIYQQKTTALFKASVRIGAIAGKAKANKLIALSRYGAYVGFAFQVIDDLSETDQDKITYVSLAGREKSRTIANEKINQAKEELKIFGEKAEVLSGIADYIFQRAR